MTVQRRDGDEVIAETGGAVLGTLIGLSAGLTSGNPGVGAVVGAGSVPLMERWTAKIRNEFGRRGAALAGAASRTSGLPENEVVERLLEADEVQPLVARVLEAASRTNSQQTLRLLGGVLGEAANHRPNKIDEDLMLVDGITDLTPSHLRLLEVMETHLDPSNPQQEYPPFWGFESLIRVLGASMSSVGLKAALGGLAARGLAEIPPGMFAGPTSYRLTDFGLALLGALRRVEGLDTHE